MQAAELARGRWRDLLTHFGIPGSLLMGKHVPCPVCGGRDRFRFDDQEGRGTFYCSHCGSGDGFRLLGLVQGWSFRQAADAVEEIVATVPVSAPKHPPSGTDKLEVCRRIWHASKAVVAGDPVHAYLERRTGIVEIPDCIRFHPALPYRHHDGSVTRHPAMVAKVLDVNGKGCAIHRTYLTLDGQKANLPDPKKALGTLAMSSAIRLSPSSACIGIAEGIETALSAAQHFSVPVWACLSACGMERWRPPPETARVIVFGDNDLNGVGQAAAWNLAKQLATADMSVDVKIPDNPGYDWNDVFVQLSGKSGTGLRGAA